jgi:hypothetical protein
MNIIELSVFDCDIRVTCTDRQAESLLNSNYGCFKQPVNISMVTGYSRPAGSPARGCFVGMADRCGPSVIPLPNLPRQFMNLLRDFWFLIFVVTPALIRLSFALSLGGSWMTAYITGLARRKGQGFLVQ